MSFAHNVWLSNADISPGYVFDVNINLKFKTCARTQIDSCSAEFPSTHPYRHGRTGTRFLYLMASDREERLPFRDIVKVSV